jgi:hypothetical protein
VQCIIITTTTSTTTTTTITTTTMQLLRILMSFSMVTTRVFLNRDTLAEYRTDLSLQADRTGRQQCQDAHPDSSWPTTWSKSFTYVSLSKAGLQAVKKTTKYTKTPMINTYEKHGQHLQKTHGQQSSNISWHIVKPIVKFVKTTMSNCRTK